MTSETSREQLTQVVDEALERFGAVISCPAPRSSTCSSTCGCCCSRSESLEQLLEEPAAHRRRCRLTASRSAGSCSVRMAEPMTIAASRAAPAPSPAHARRRASIGVVVAARRRRGGRRRRARRRGDDGPTASAAPRRRTTATPRRATGAERLGRPRRPRRSAPRPPRAATSRSFDAPDAARAPATTLSTHDRVPRCRARCLAFDQYQDWLHVYLPDASQQTRPGGCKASDVDVSKPLEYAGRASASPSIKLCAAAQRRGRARPPTSRSASHAVPDTRPAPSTSPIRSTLHTAARTRAYGVFAVGLSGHSDVLTRVRRRRRPDRDPRHQRPAAHRHTDVSTRLRRAVRQRRASSRSADAARSARPVVHHLTAAAAQPRDSRSELSAQKPGSAKGSLVRGGTLDASGASTPSSAASPS